MVHFKRESNFPLNFFLTINIPTRAGAEAYYRREYSDAALWGSFVTENQPRESCSPQCEP